MNLIVQIGLMALWSFIAMFFLLVASWRLFGRLHAQGIYVRSYLVCMVFGYLAAHAFMHGVIFVIVFFERVLR